MALRSRHIEQLLPSAGDSGTVKLAFTVSGVEAAGIGSLGTLNLALTPGAAYEGLNSEFGTLNFAFRPSGIDSQLINEAGTAALKFTPSGVEAPQYFPVEGGTIYLDLQPITEEEVFAIEYDDAGTIRLNLTPLSHECFNHATPLYDFSLDKRWQIPASMGRWDVDVYEKRWNVYCIGDETFDNSCP